MVKIINGETMEVLKTIDNGSIHCCATSPPYWGLRDYGGCSCGAKRYKEETNQGIGTGGALNYRVNFDPNCKACNGSGRIHGMDSQLGLERTPEEYVAKMVKVFREVRRVLRDDGTLWLNLGDSYAGGPSSGSNGWKTGSIGSYSDKGRGSPVNKVVSCLKPKDLCGIPWAIAFALRADGWYLRHDIIWHKPNPMPESVTDRCTKAHEYIFLLAKSARYYYDAEAISESLKCLPHAPGNLKLDESRNDHDQMNKVWGSNGKRNRRSVWTVPTAPYPGAHFATFPPKLIEPCILAGCPQGGTVLDPFGGSGTVGMVAEDNGRNSILIELNPKYVEMARKRTAQQNLFNVEAANG